MHRLGECEAGQPAPVHQGPGRSVVVMALAQQEAGQLLARLAQSAHRRQARAHKITDRLMGLVGNPNRRQLASAVQPGKVDRIPPVGLDAVTGLARDQRRSDHGTSVPALGQLPLNAVAARAGLITKPQLAAAAAESCSQRLQGNWGVRDLSMLAHFPPLARLGHRDRDRILVNIQADVGDKLFQDPSPYA